MTFARSLQALMRAEKQYIDEWGYEPVEAVTMIYDRAVNYYDNVFPNDETNFRQTLIKKREDRLKWAVRKTTKERKENDAMRDESKDG